MRQVLPGLACLARSMILIMAIVVIETSVFMLTTCLLEGTVRCSLSHLHSQ